MTPARFRWGMLLVLLGTLLLLVNADVLNHNFWIDFVYFIPFLLIAIGIEKIFSHTRLKIISYVTTVAIVAGALYVAFDGSSYTESGSFFESSTLVLDEDRAKVDLIDAELGLGTSSLTIRDASDELLRARFGEWSRKPASELKVDNRVATISLDSRSGRRVWGGTVRVDTDAAEDWRVAFGRDIPLNLEITGQENDLSLNLATTQLRRLSIDDDDAEIYVKVGDLESTVQLKIMGDDSRVRLRVPQEAGLMVTGVNDPSYLEQIGLEARGGDFATPGFEQATVRIQAELQENFRSLSIDYY
jgi:hypothetical protein